MLDNFSIYQIARIQLVHFLLSQKLQIIFLTMQKTVFNFDVSVIFIGFTKIRLFLGKIIGDNVFRASWCKRFVISV